MQKITLLMASALFCLTSYAQVASEDFESGSLPDGWSTTVFSGDCDFEFGSGLPTGDDFSSTGIFIDDDACGNGAPVSVVTIFTAQYDLSSLSTAFLNVDVAFQESGDQIFVIEIYDEDANENVAVLQTFEEDLDPDVQTFSYDISEFVAANTSFRFTYNDDPDGDGEGSWGWHAGIDNFSITEEALSIETITETQFSMFPNPAVNELNVTSTTTIDQVKVFNLLGQVVLDQKVNATSQLFDISQLKSGAYLVQVSSEGQIGTYKLLKQ